MWGLIPCLTLTPALLALRHRYSKQGKLNQLHRWVGMVYIGLSVVVAVRELPNHHLILACFAILALIGLLNSQFYIFLSANRGVAFLFAAIPFHLLYHFYNGISFFAGMGRHYWASLGGHFAEEVSPEAIPVEAHQMDEPENGKDFVLAPHRFVISHVSKSRHESTQSVE